MKHFSVRERGFSEKAGGNSVNEGLARISTGEGDSVKRSAPLREPPDSEN